MRCLPCAAETKQPHQCSDRFFRVPIQLVVLRVSSPHTPELDTSAPPGAVQRSDRVLSVAITDGLVDRVTLGDRMHGVGEWKVEDAVGHDGESLQCLSDAPFVLASSLRNVEREPQRGRKEVEDIIRTSADQMTAAKEALAQDMRDGQEVGQRRGVAVTRMGAALSKVCTRLRQLGRWGDLSDVLISMALLDGFCSDHCSPGTHHTLRLHLLLSLCSGGDIDERREEEEMALGPLSHSGRRAAPSTLADDEPRSYRLHLLCLTNEQSTEQLMRAAMAYHPHRTALAYTPRFPFHDTVGHGHEHLIGVLLPDADVDRKGGWVERMKLCLTGQAGLRYGTSRTTKARAATTTAKALKPLAAPSAYTPSISPISTPPSKRLLWWLQRYRGGLVRKGKAKKAVDAAEVRLLCNGEEAEAMELFDLVSVVDFRQTDPARAVLDARAEVQSALGGWTATAAMRRQQQEEESAAPAIANLMSDLFPSLNLIQQQASDAFHMQRVRAAHIAPTRPHHRSPSSSQ